MIKFSFGSSLWQLIVQSDATSLFVLFILLCMSILCWTVLIYKFFALRKSKTQLRRSLSLIYSVYNLQGIRSLIPLLKDSCAAFFLRTVNSTVTNLAEQSSASMNNSVRRNLLDQSLDQSVDVLLTHEEQYIPILSATVSVAPLLGLFGTVWGLVHSFMTISEIGSADIATIAPGIAEALVTTLAGLVVAVPAVLMYHYLKIQLNTIEQLLLQLRDHCIWIIHLDNFGQQQEVKAAIVTPNIVKKVQGEI